VILVTLVIVGGMLIFFRRQRWIWLLRCKEL
jgi:hypothetical protein